MRQKVSTVIIILVQELVVEALTIQKLSWILNVSIICFKTTTILNLSRYWLVKKTRRKNFYESQCQRLRRIFDDYSLKISWANTIVLSSDD